MAPSRIIIAGAQGLLGRHLVAAWLASGRDVEILGLGRSPRSDDHYTHQIRWRDSLVSAPLPDDMRRFATHPSYDYISLDVRDSSAVADTIRRFEPELLIHAAAALRDEPWPDLSRSNLDTVIGLVEGISLSNAAVKFLLVSSGSVYGAAANISVPLLEDSPRLPIELYGVSKSAGEDLMRVSCTEREIPWLCARVFNLLGPGLQHRHLAAHLTGQLAEIKLGLSDPIVHVGALSTSRDFVDVRDAAAAILLVAETGSAGETYNVASGVETTGQAILDTSLRVSQLVDKVQFRSLPPRRADLMRSYAAINKLEALGFRPANDLERSLRSMLEYYIVSIAGSCA